MRILDLFSGAGGAAMGLHQAFPDAEIVGIDIRPQKRYPFTFVQADAMTYPLDGFDFVWASPPCQPFTTMGNRYRGNGQPADPRINLLEDTRARLELQPIPWIIENVVGARSRMRSPILLHGGMFDLGVHRPRLFDASFLILVPIARQIVNPVGVYGKRADNHLLWTRRDGTEQRASSSISEASAAMGIDWMDWHELTEAVPPAYSKYLAQFIPLGVQL